MQEFHDPAYPGETRMHNIPGDHSSCSGSQDNYTIKVNRQEKKKPSFLRASLINFDSTGVKVRIILQAFFCLLCFRLQEHTQVFSV